MRTVSQSNRNAANPLETSGQPARRRRSDLRGLPVTAELLVSVRTPSEIDDAVTAQVDIVDLKEPQRGALAPANVELWRHAAARWQHLTHPLPSAVPRLSAALGEATEATQLARSLPPQFTFAKAGPRGCTSLRRIQDLWSQLRDQLDERIELVAVAYADSAQADCLPPETIFQAAMDSGFERCLIDTWTKDGRSTLDHLGIDGLIRLDDVARAGTLWWALAGSLRAGDVATLVQQGVAPDCFAVRGDVCGGNRTGRLSRDRVQIWKDVIAVNRPNPGGSC